MKKAIITGAAGFIGRHTIPPLLKAGFELHAVDISKPLSSFPQVAWHSVDLHNTQEIKKLVRNIKAPLLLHLAWNVKHGEYMESPENLPCVSSSLSLIKQFAENGGQRVVCAGTCAEYLWGNVPLHEEKSEMNPHSLYGISKLSLYSIVRKYLANMGLSVCWGRLFHLYGPWENPLRFVPYIIKNLLTSKKAYLGHCRQKRDYLHVSDVGHAFATLLNSNFDGPINIGSGKPVEQYCIANEIAKQIGKPELLSFSAIHPQVPAAIFPDTSRIFKETNWRPAHSLKSGIADSIAWWKRSDSKHSQE